MISNRSTGSTLRVLAWLQAVVIAGLAVVALRGDEIAPLETAPAQTSQPTPAPAGPAQGTHAPSPVSEPPPATEPQPPQPEPDHQPSVVAAPPAGTVVFGRVTDDVGEDIKQGSVWFRREGDTKRIASIRLQQGRSHFAIAGVAPGKLDYQTRVPGHKEQRGSIEIPVGVARVRQDLVLEPSWTLIVKVLTPEGEPLHLALQAARKGRRMLRHVQVCAVVTSSQPQADFRPTALREVTAGLGRWQGATGIAAITRGGARQAKDVAGTIEIDQKQPLWVSAVMRHRVLTSVLVEPGQAEVILTVPLQQVLSDLCTIRGRVVDAATGAPMAKAAIGFGDLQSSGSAGKADDEGRFEVTNLRPGLLDVEIRAERRSARRDLVLLQPGQVVDLGDVPVFEHRVIKGRCEGLAGKGEDCRIYYTPLEPTTHSAVRRRAESSRVDADGSFLLSLPEGPYRLRATGAGGCITNIDTRTLGDQPLVLHLAAEADLRLDVQTNGEPWELALFDSRGDEIYRRELRDGWKFALRFPPGDYRAELIDSHGKKHIRSVHLGTAGADLPVR